MISSTFLTGTIVAFGFRVVIASPCRPSSQAGLSSETVLSLSISSETFLAPTPIFETSTTDEIYFSETATLSLSSFATESVSSISSLMVDAGTDSTGLYSTAVSSATETGSTAAVTSEESTTIATTATSETTTWPISDTATSVETEATAWATIETTDGPTTAFMRQTTTQETPASTTESTLPPVRTFELVARSQSLGDVVMHTDGLQVLISTYTFPSSWSSSITYDEETQHLKVNDAYLCVMHDSTSRLAALMGCGSVLTRQQRYLTCQPPSATGLVCNQRAMKYDDGAWTDLGYTWDRFYLLGFDEGSWLIVIGADGLTTERDAPLQGIEPVDMDIRASFS